jgi:hypothetical protein
MFRDRKQNVMQRELKAIAGIGPAHDYAEGSGDSPEADQIRAILSQIDPKKLTGDQVDHLKRVLAAGIAGLNARDKAFDGRERDWDRHSLAEKKDRRYGSLAHEEGWVDHTFRILGPEEKRVRYVSEPYDLNEEAIRRLAALLDAGYTVRIMGWSTHFPGRTFRIVVEDRERYRAIIEARWQKRRRELKAKDGLMKEPTAAEDGPMREPVAPVLPGVANAPAAGPLGQSVRN